MGRSHKIWVDARGGSAKGFGCGQDDINMTVYVGSSASNSNELAEIKIEHWESGDEIGFNLMIDGQVYRSCKYNRKSQEFSKITGRRITGNPKLQKKREEESSNSMLKMVANVAAMGEILAGPSKKEKNDWKARMIKAGLDNKGLIMPENWDSLNEDEKENRLNGVIDILREDPKAK